MEITYDTQALRWHHEESFESDWLLKLVDPQVYAIWSLRLQGVPWLKGQDISTYALRRTLQRQVQRQITNAYVLKYIFWANLSSMTSSKRTTCACRHFFMMATSFRILFSVLLKRSVMGVWGDFSMLLFRRSFSLSAFGSLRRIDFMAWWLE